MNTAHLYNKARKRWLATQDLESWAASSGFNLDTLLDRLREDIAAKPANRLTAELSQAAYALAVGIEIGKLLCDPATHLEPGDMDPVRAAAQSDPRGERDR